MPNLYHSYDYSYDQLLDGLSFIGNNYEKFIELFTAQVEGVYGIDTSKAYFDCTNSILKLIERMILEERVQVKKIERILLLVLVFY